MIILTGANIDVGKESHGKWYEGFSFKSVIQDTARKAEELGYKPVIYDLGSLGLGEPYKVVDESFTAKGYYEKEVLKGYKSRSLFKPDMVKHCMARHRDLIVYLDGDAQLVDSIDEVNTDDYDVGVTLRDESEFVSQWYREHFKIAKYVNAGVIFFNSTSSASHFINSWQQLTHHIGNDQAALNELTSPSYYPEPGSVEIINDVRIKYFPCKQYNFYYFDEGLVPHIKIMHFKGLVRHFYPFDWKKRWYCSTVIPVMNKVRQLRNKRVSMSPG